MLDLPGRFYISYLKYIEELNEVLPKELQGSRRVISYQKDSINKNIKPNINSEMKNYNNQNENYTKPIQGQI